MSPIDLDRALTSFRPDRRGFLRALVIGTAYTAPVVASFSMDGLVGPASAGPSPLSNVCVPGSNLAPIQIQKEGLPNPVVAGENLTYTINVLNCQNAPISNPQFRDQLPMGATFVSATQVFGVTNFTLTKPAVGAEGGVVSGIADDPMNANELARFQIVVHVNP